MTPSLWTRLSNPSHFMRWSGALVPWLTVLSLGVLTLGLYQTFFVVPPDYQQGETVRLMYIHVPAAWLGVFFYGAMSVSAIGTLVWRHPLADVAQRAAAPIGAAFTLICLVTGSLWGKPMWGTYWVWDARLTSMLILLLIYCGIIALWRTLEDPNRAARAVARASLAASRGLSPPGAVPGSSGRAARVASGCEVVSDDTCARRAQRAPARARVAVTDTA